MTKLGMNSEIDRINKTYGAALSLKRGTFGLGFHVYEIGNVPSSLCIEYRSDSPNCARSINYGRIVCDDAKRVLEMLSEIESDIMLMLADKVRSGETMTNEVESINELVKIRETIVAIYGEETYAKLLESEKISLIENFVTMPQESNSFIDFWYSFTGDGEESYADACAATCKRIQELRAIFGDETFASEVYDKCKIQLVFG